MNQTKGQPCTSLMIAREALLSAAIASRYYFFWLLVALAPRGEVQRRYSWNQTLPTPANSKTHSGAWERWGIAGLILKHALLLGVAASGTMHVIWRLGFVLNLDFFKPVHSAVTIVEMVLMVFFLVKLTLNVWISPMLPRWNTLRDYSPLLLAGLINLVVSIAELHSRTFCFATSCLNFLTTT